jgi:plasmid maintenance system antidote protein VapI
VEITKEEISAFKKRVGDRLRSLRISAGFGSAGEAAEAIGVHPNSIYELERGENFLSPEMVVRLSAAYKVEPGALLPGVEASDKTKIIECDSPTHFKALDLISKLDVTTVEHLLALIRPHAERMSQRSKRDRAGGS